MAQLNKPAGHGLRQQPVRSRSPIALDGWPWSIRREFQNRQGAAQLRFPVGKLLLQHLAPQPFPLPDRKVAVLDGQLRKR